MKINFFNIIILSCLFFLIKCDNSSKDSNSKDEHQLYISHPGDLLYRQNCAICHSLDGSEKLGPSLKEIYGKKVELNNEGSFLIVDDEYIINSIIYPDKDIVIGYSNTMPSFKDVLSIEEINSLIDFIKLY